MLHKRGTAYSQDLRERVFAMDDENLRVGQIADALRVTSSYVSKALGRLRRTGERTARPQRCRVPPKLAPHYDSIRQQVTERPDQTLAELRRWVLQAHNVSASSGLLSETLRLLGLTLKKSRCAPPSKTGLTSLRREPNGARTKTSWTPSG
jgi:transposase